jgi:hypothetical protein
MKQHSSGFIIGIIASIILGFGVVAGIALGLRSIAGLGYEPDVVQATKTGPNSATLNLSTFPDSQVCHPDAGALQLKWVTYCAANGAQGTSLEVPPNSLITVIIKQYDSTTNLINDYFQQVLGTVGNPVVLNGKPYALYNGKPYSSSAGLPAPGHTFTLQSTPDSTYPIFVSVPLIGVSSTAPANVTINGNSYPTPNIIQFQFRTGPAGITYVWHCYDPCGDSVYARNPPFGFSGPMGTTGYMAGTMSVASY